MEHVRSDLISRGPVLVKDDPLVENLTEKVAVMTGLVRIVFYFQRFCCCNCTLLNKIKKTFTEIVQ